MKKSLGKVIYANYVGSTFIGYSRKPVTQSTKKLTMSKAQQKINASYFIQEK